MSRPSGWRAALAALSGLALSGLALSGLAAVLGGGTRALSAEPVGAVFALSNGQSVCRLQVQVANDGPSPEARWSEFLDRYLAYFDRNGDGLLADDELRRMPPLPRCHPAQPLQLELAEVDQDADDQVGPRELKQHCRRHGFGPVVGLRQGPSAVDRHLGERLSAALGARHNSTSPGEKLASVRRALAPWDLDDDEYLDLAELLSGLPQQGQPPALERAAGDAPFDLVLRLELGQRPTAHLERRSAGTKPVEPSLQAGGRLVLSPLEHCLLLANLAPRRPDFRSTAEFLLAQLTNALRGRAALPAAEIRGDAALGGLLDLLAFADRNQDAQLTPAEMTAYLELIEQGWQAQVVLVLTNFERNCFPLGDLDADQRWSCAELAAACRMPVLASAPDRCTCYVLEVGGTTASAWGGVPLPVGEKKAPTAATATGPAWFLALDRNLDGVVSTREFPGPPAAFQRLDLDGSGLIELPEATAAAPGN